MIKINLATRKRAVATSGTRTGSKTTFTTLTNTFSRMDLSGAKGQPTRRLLINGIAAAAAFWLLQTYKEDELKVWDARIAKQTAEQGQLEADLRKFTNVEDKQKALNGDEQLIRSKMQAIMALTQNRGATPKLLMTVSGGIPKEIWLETIKLADEDFHVNGLSYTSGGTGYDQITDFMTLLTQSAFLKDIKLVSTEKKIDEAGTEVAAFELSAKKR